MLAMSKNACNNFQIDWSVCRGILWLYLKQKNSIFPASAWSRKVALLCWTCTTYFLLTPDWSCKEIALDFCPDVPKERIIMFYSAKSKTGKSKPRTESICFQKCAPDYNEAKKIYPVIKQKPPNYRK